MTCPGCLALQAELDALAPRWTPARTIETPIVVVSEANARDHHHAKAGRIRRQQQATWAALATLEITRAPSLRSLLLAHLRLRVTLTRLGAKALDDDNLSGAFKAVRDAVAHHLGVDDGPRGPITWAYAQEAHRRHRLTPGIRIEIATPAPRRQGAA